MVADIEYLKTRVGDLQRRWQVIKKVKKKKKIRDDSLGFEDSSNQELLDTWQKENELISFEQEEPNDDTGVEEENITLQNDTDEVNETRKHPKFYQTFLRTVRFRFLRMYRALLQSSSIGTIIRRSS